jgi:hypothetical protein
MEGTTLYVADTVGPLDVSHVFVLFGILNRASESRGWHGLSGWIKDNSGEKRGTGGTAKPNNTIRMKKKVCRDLIEETAGDALRQKTAVH